jgi:hypothetical protein
MYRYTGYPDYQTLCSEIDSGTKLSYWSHFIVPCLVGGGRRCIQGQSASTDGGDNADWFVCQNTGTEKLKWAIEKGYKLSNDAFVSAVESNNIDALDILKRESKSDINHEYLLDVAIEEDHYEATRWVIENFEISRKRQLLCSNIQILLYLKSKGFTWDASTYIEAIKNKDIDTIKYLREQEVPWIEDENLIRYGTGRNMYGTICHYLARAGDVETMKWCLNNGLPFGDKCCDDANTIDMIIYLIGLGSKVTSITWESCMNNIETFKWLAENGYGGLDEKTCHRCHCYGSNEVQQWINDNYEKYMSE